MRNYLNYQVTTNTNTNRQNQKPTGHDHGHENAQSKPMVATMGNSPHPIFSRTILFDQEINEETATMLRAEVLSKAAEDPKAPIFLMLGSPGGGLYESLAIYDTFQLISNPIIAICTGKVMSGGILILLGCDVRLSTANTTFMIHHGHTMLQGNVVQLEEQLNEIKSLNDRMLDIIIKKTLISREQLKAYLVKDHYMNTIDAIKHGLIDNEIESIDQLVDVDNQVNGQFKKIEIDEEALTAFLNAESSKKKKKTTKKASKKKTKTKRK